MRTLVQLTGIAALALAGFSANATDFGPLMEVAHSTWADKGHIGVVADYTRSREEILALALAAGVGNRITVLDTRGQAEVERACALLAGQVRPDFVVLLPSDPLVWDGSFAATMLVNRMARKGIPTIATTPRAMAQGAVFALGEATGLQLLVTDRMIGTVGVILPHKGHYVESTASLGLAQVAVVASR